jgi:hypothetical protein
MTKPMIAPDDARAERAKRELARRHFLPFCGYVDKRYPREAKHLQYLCGKLEQVYEFIESGGTRGIGRLMIFMPPRYWKSSTASQKFPAWVLGKLPDTRVMLGSFGAELAGEHSGKVRDIIEEMKYQAIFGQKSTLEVPVEVSDDKSKATNWALENHAGGMMSAGVDGAFVGRGGHLLILDDPFKGRQEAESEARRKLVMKFYRSSFYTRQEDGAAIIIIMTRWDQEDVAGQLLTSMVSDPDADQWEVVSMPAAALDEKEYPKTEEEYRENLLRGIFVPMGGDQLGRAPGEALWPEKHNAKQLKTIASNTDDFEYSSQYQQSPRLASGGFFDDTDFKIVEWASVERGLQWFRYIDLALGQTDSSDFNAVYAVAFDSQGDLLIRDPLKVRNYYEFMPQCKALMLSPDERNVVWGVEDVAFQALAVQEFLQDKELVNIPIMGITPRDNKKTRALPWQQRAKKGKVKLIRGPWNQGFVRIAAGFPGGRIDDDIDSVSGGVQMQAEFGPLEHDGDVISFAERVSISPM